MGNMQGLTVESTVGDRSRVGFLNFQDYRKNPERKQTENEELLRQAQPKHEAGLQKASVLYTAIVIICLVIVIVLGISLLNKKKQLRKLKAKKRKLNPSPSDQRMIVNQDRNRREDVIEMTNFYANPPNYRSAVSQQQYVWCCSELLHSRIDILYNYFWHNRIF